MDVEDISKHTNDCMSMIKHLEKAKGVDKKLMELQAKITEKIKMITTVSSTPFGVKKRIIRSNLNVASPFTGGRKLE